MKFVVSQEVLLLFLGLATCSTQAAFIRSTPQAALNSSKVAAPREAVHQALAAAATTSNGTAHSRSAAKDSAKLDKSRSQNKLVVSKQGGTACQCICGDRTVWRRAIFEGDVVKEKEKECEFEICPSVNIPGLNVVAKCEYTDDITELTGGTVCSCTCGGKQVWRQRRFYGEVVEEKEEYCLKEVCPKVAQLPGMISETQCKYDPKLFKTGGAAGSTALRWALVATITALLRFF